MSPFNKTNREYQIFENLQFITIYDKFLPFAKPGRPISTLCLPFLDQLCAQTKMQQHIDFPVEISVLKGVRALRGYFAPPPLWDQKTKVALYKFLLISLLEQ